MRDTAPCTVFSCEILDERPGMVVLEVAGRDAAKLFAGEAGGHRWQRVPVNDKRGRRHTSTVTVAVLPLIDDPRSVIHDSEIEWQATRGSGPGGQHRNKTASAVQMRHKPTGITVRIETSRSQSHNRETARRILEARVAEQVLDKTNAVLSKSRRDQIGSGMRGDKVRTIRLQDGVVVDHRTGRRTTTTRYLRGDLDGLLSHKTVR